MASTSLVYDIVANDNSSKTLDKFAANVSEKIGGAFTKLGSTIGGELGEVVSKVGEGIESLGEKSTSASEKVAVVGAGVTGVGAAMSMLGSGAQQAQAQLSAAFTGAGSSVSDYSEEIEGTVASMEKYGHSDEDTKNALAGMTEALGDPSKALENMGLVADYAAAKHTSLTDASNVLARTLSGGSTRAFTAFGIQIGKNKDGTADLDTATEQLAGKLSGQASAAVDSTAGKLGVLKTQVTDQAAELSAKYGPAVTAAGTALAGLGGVMQLVNSLKAASAARAAAATAAQLAETGATEAGTVAQTGFNVAMLASPVTWIIVGVVALVAAIVLLATHWSQVTKIGTDAWNGLKGAWSAAGSWFKGIGSDIAGVFTGLPSKLATAGKDVANVLTWPIRSAFNALADVYDDSIGKLHITVPSWVPGIGGKGFDMPQMPHIPSFATGVTNFGGGLAYVHADELVDLPTGANVYTKSQTRQMLDNPTRGGLTIGTLNTGASAADIFDELEWRARRR